MDFEPSRKKTGVLVLMQQSEATRREFHIPNHGLRRRRLEGTQEIWSVDTLRIGSTKLLFELAGLPKMARIAASLLSGGIILVLSLTLLLACKPVGAPERTWPSPTLVSTPTVPFPPPTATPTSGPTLHDAQAAAVLLEVPVGTGGTYIGSGSIIDPSGLILTNFHVLGDPQTGEFYNKERTVYVALTLLPDGVPGKRYQAMVEIWGTQLDLAVVRIIAEQDGTPLEKPLELPAVVWGDSDVAKIGDVIRILGFPGVGGESLTVTEGTVSGFIIESGRRLWIKTDAEINRGTSGGLAVDERGRLIGVPSAVVGGASLDKLGYVRPVNLAVPLIQEIPPPGSTPSPTWTPTPTTPVRPPLPTFTPTPTPHYCFEGQVVGREETGMNQSQIHGKVLDRNGRGIGGAVVKFRAWNTELFAMTIPSGYYSIDAIFNVLTWTGQMRDYPSIPVEVEFQKLGERIYVNFVQKECP